jgi:putative membrane protein
MALALVGGGIAVAGEPDRGFVEKAAAGGMAEVKLANLAMDKGQTVEVKQFARKMLEDHNKANTELKQLAEKKGLSLPSQIDDKHRRVYDRLTKLSGVDFDREYMRVMTDDHDETVKLFKTEMQNGQDPELKSFAIKTLPTIEKHDEMAHMNADTLSHMNLREK